MSKNYGKKIRDLNKNEGEAVGRNAIKHGVAFNQNDTLGMAAHYDTEYGQADPRAEAAKKQLGDFTSRGGSGPDNKG